MRRIPGIRSDVVSLDVALNVKSLSWLDLLLCTNHIHIHRSYQQKGNKLNRGCRCTAAAVMLVHTVLVWRLQR